MSGFGQDYSASHVLPLSTSLPSTGVAIKSRPPKPFHDISFCMAPICPSSSYPDGMFVVTGNLNSLEIWNMDPSQLNGNEANQGNIIATVPTSGLVQSCKYLNSLGLVIAGVDGGDINIYDIDMSPYPSNPPVVSLVTTLHDSCSAGSPPGGTCTNFAVSFFNDAGIEKVLSGNNVGSIQIWDVANKNPIQSLNTGQHAVAALLLKHDNSILYTATYIDSSIQIWSLSTNELVGKLNGHSAAVNFLTFANPFPSEENILVSSSADRTNKIWNLETGQNTTTLTGHYDIPKGAIFLTLSKYKSKQNVPVLLSSANDGHIFFYDFSNIDLTQVQKRAPPIVANLVSPGGPKYYSPIQGGINIVAPGGNMTAAKIIVGTADQGACVWDFPEEMLP